MTTNPSTFIPKKADPEAWEALVRDGIECVLAWLSTNRLTPAEWGAALGGDGEADDLRTDFAQAILDHPPLPEDLHPSLHEAFIRQAYDENRWNPDSDLDTIKWATVEVAWREAVMEAEDRLGI